MARNGTATTTKSRTTKSRKTPSNRRRPARDDKEITATNLTPQDKRYLTSNASKLSRTTRRAKWINSQDERADRNGQALATRNHDVIKHWAEERGAVPATIPGTEHGKTLGVLRLNFPGYGGGNLQEVNWDQWFNTFDKRKLTFLFQQNLRNGNQSNFFRLDSPLREEG